MSLLDQLRAPRLRDYWVRWGLRRVHYADRTRKLGLLYQIENPWDMDSAREQVRFAWTNGVISTHLARPKTLLEIGCGEGHRSQHLVRLCDRLYGIDISARGAASAAALPRGELRCRRPVHLPLRRHAAGRGPRRRV
jgi:SAM-dependent methyltransferase